MFLLAIIYTCKYKFAQIRFVKESKKVMQQSKSVYMTFLMTLASHIGAGNIVGVTTALIYGGPGALLWMGIACFFTSIFSLMENTLAVRYREKINGENRGGSCYYICHGLKRPLLAVVFSGFLVLNSTIFFGPIQVNTIVEAIIIPFNIKKIYILFMLLFIAFFIIFRGTKKILKFVEIIVPIMTLCFLSISVLTIMINFREIPKVIKLIFQDAFTFQSLKGALLGGALIIGLKRSSFSNEAGLGTAPSISAMSDNPSAISQGYVQVLGVFVDTVLMCTLMGFMILVYDINLIKFEGASLAVHVFEVIFGNFGLYLGAFFLFTFAIATWVSSYYAGESNMLYLTQKLKISQSLSLWFYRLLYLTGTVCGIYLANNILWDFVDYGLVFLGTINLYAILKLEKEFKIELHKLPI
jgi:AGCS family alanine or glycine:cation symporter